VQVEVLRVAYEEGSALGAAMREKMAEAPPSVGAAGANATPCVDGAHAKEAEPRLEDASGPMALTPRSLRGPGFTPSREAALDAVMSVPGSFNVADLGTRELGLLGYPPSATLACPLEASSGGCGVVVFVGSNRAPTAEGDIGCGWSGCSATSLGQS
jgi:hypothetical protein